MRRVAITGIGLVTSIGTGAEDVWRNALAGTSGARGIQAFDPSRIPTKVACEVPDFDPGDFMDRKAARRMDRFAQMVVAAGGMALDDAGLDPAGIPEAGVYIGSGIGGLTTFVEQTTVMIERGPDRLSPFFIPMIIPNMGAAQVSMTFGLRGPLIATVSACATSNHSIGEAFDAIRLGRADVILAGGSECSINEIGMAAFNAMRALSTREDAATASRPFDVGRDGFVMGEAGAVLILEELSRAQARGARIYAELCGYGLSGDAHHLTEPDPSGTAPAAAITMALRDAGADPEEVDYINAHATSTPVGDPSEIRVIKMALGEEKAARTLVSSTKSMHGHCLGAAGGVEAALTAMALQNGIVPPTINLADLDPECTGVDHVANTPRTAPIRTAVSNAFGFGGHNAALVMRRWEG
ncbi:MAG: beta-ketoacyl-ACP synthase II [Thermoleophilia bacterium]